MYQKNNPWISLVALLLMVLIVVLNCTGCTVRASWGGEEAAPGDGRRTVITDPGAVSRAVITEPTETMEATEETKTTGNRFNTKFKAGGFPYFELYVITDNQTGVQYLVCSGATGIGLTKLEG